MKKLIYIFIMLSICWSAVTAQETETPAREKYPSLYGHKFPSTSYMRSSFISTHVQADIGIGNTSVLEIPGIEVGEYEIFNFTGQLMYFDLDVQYQQRFTPWLALFITAKMSGRVGTEMSTILVDGVNTLSGGTIGWLVRIMQTQKFNLTGSMQLNNVNGSFINVPAYIEELIENEPYPSVIKQVPSMSAGLGLRGAYAFNPTWGIQFNMDYYYGESLQREVSQSYFSAGIIGDVDFNPKRDVPIGLSLGYILSTAPVIVMENGGTANLAIGSIRYSGAEDFELALQFTYYSAYLNSIQDKAFVKKTMLTFKFYF